MSNSAFNPIAITSPLTTKGDLWGFGTANARVPVGTDGKSLVADSAQASGLNYDSLIIYEANITTLDAFSLNVDGDADWAYDISIHGTINTSGGLEVELRMAPNNDTGANYKGTRNGYGWYGADVAQSLTENGIWVARTVAGVSQYVNWQTRFTAKRATYRGADRVGGVKNVADANTAAYTWNTTWLNSADNITTLNFAWTNGTTVDLQIMVRKWKF